jgi:pyridoxamine 5'-phosphate oxidase-like protein
MDLCDPAVARVAGRAQFAYLAVETGGGPHVTPVLFAATQDRLWFAVARSTLKARVLARRPQVGVLIRGRSSSVVVGGTGSPLDPMRPADVAARLPELARAPLAIPSYGVRNAAELLGFARDAAARSSPPDLVLVSVRPRAIELVRHPPERDADGRRASPGPWKSALEQVPSELAALALRPGPAVLGWMTPHGPLAVPARWEPGRARVRWSPLADQGASSAGPACLCLDVTHGRGPNAKEGLLLRGEGRAGAGGDVRSVSLRPDRITYWRGVETETIAV